MSLNLTSMLTKVGNALLFLAIAPLISSGRIARLHYLALTLLSFSPFLVLMSFSLLPDNGVRTLLINTFVVISLLYLTIAQFSLAIRRLHDMGFSGYWVVPVLMLSFCWIVLLLWPGKAATNKYGRTPTWASLNLPSQ
ncbi:DUF805 domain-containing protein [Pseudomonas sp.]|uniref:DUF805 domain-containing protein n=1 Tax=Pseudomonas sp. TaxID=306 RepID=UPI003C786F31